MRRQGQASVISRANRLRQAERVPAHKRGPGRQRRPGLEFVTNPLRQAVSEVWVERAESSWALPDIPARLPRP